MYGIYERYASPSVFTRDQDQAPITLEDLARRVGQIELAIRLLAEGDGGEAEAVDTGPPDAGPQPVQGAAAVARSVGQVVSPDETPGFKPPAKSRPGISSDRRPTVDQVGRYNRYLTKSTNSAIADINRRNAAAYDQRTGSLRIAS